MQRIHVYIDGDNIYYLQKDLGWKLDFLKLLVYFKQFGDVKGAYYYVCKFEEDRNKSGKQKFLNQLSLMGILVKSRETREVDGEPVVLKCPHCENLVKGNNKYWKSDVDLEMALDVVLNMDQYDTAILVTGDGDFCGLLDKIVGRGKNVKVVHAKHHISNHLLKRIVGQDFIDLSGMKDQLVLNRKPYGGHDGRIFESGSEGSGSELQNGSDSNEVSDEAYETGSNRDGGDESSDHIENKDNLEAGANSMESQETGKS